MSRTVLITGATSGLGRELATALANEGLKVLVHGRDVARTEDLARELGAQPYIADLASLGQVRDLAQQVRSDYPELHILINNAGVGAGTPPFSDRAESADGHELRLAVNYLAPVLLARLLTPALIAGAPSRIVNVGSIGQAPLDFDDLQFHRNFHGFEAYCRSKFALAAFTFDLAEELEGTGVTVNCLHPATFMNTAMVLDAGVDPLNTVESGVRAVLNLAIGEDGEVHNGEFFDGPERAKSAPETYDRRVREQLRNATNALLDG